MPHAVGHIASPSITILACRNNAGSKKDLRNGGRHVITTDTYVKLDTVTPGCVLYFTTDGLTPDPSNRVIDGVERTFKYKGPFKLRSGTRVVSAVALCRANHRPSQESKRVFEVVEVADETNETPSEVSSSTSNTTSDDFFDFPPELSALKMNRPGSAGGSLRYHGDWADCSQLPRQRMDSEADWSSTVSDIYTDMTPRLDELDVGQRMQQRMTTPRSASGDPLVESYFGESYDRNHNPADDVSDLETDVSNYFRKSGQPGYDPSQCRISLDTQRSGLRGYNGSRTPTPRVRFQVDDAYGPSSEAIYRHGGRDEFQVGYRSARPVGGSARASSSSGWHGPLLADEGNSWDGGLHGPRSSRSDGALPRHAWVAEGKLDPRRSVEWVAGNGVHDPRVRGQPRSGYHENGEVRRKEKKGKPVEDVESSSSSSSSSSASSKSSGDSDDAGGNHHQSRKDDHGKKEEDAIARKEMKKLEKEKDRKEKESVEKLKEGKKKGNNEKEVKKNGDNEKEGKQIGEKEKEAKKKGEKEKSKGKEEKKKGEKDDEEKIGEKEKDRKEDKAKKNNKDVDKGKKEDEKMKENNKVTKETHETKKNEKNAVLPVKNDVTRTREEPSDGDSDVVGKEAVGRKSPGRAALQSRDPGLRFINDSGTQINICGVSPDDVMETLSTVLPSGKDRHANNHSEAPVSSQSFKQSPKHSARNSVVAKQPSGKLPSASSSGKLPSASSSGKLPSASSSGKLPSASLSSVPPPVARIQQHEQQTIFSSARKFFKGWGKPEKDVENRTTIRTMFKGVLDSKAGLASEIRKGCLADGRLWEDPDFPANEGSLYFKKPPTTEKVVWKRPGELCDSPQLFVGGASRFDVVQGLLGDCWLLAAVASLTADEKLLYRVVPPDQSFDKEYAGMFHCCLWRYGSWLDVCIDDRLPTVNGKLVFMHSAQNNEFWSALLEKAYAKLCGSYEALSGGLASEAMTDFTGGIVERFNFREELPDDFLQILLKAFERHSLMSCSIEPDSGKVEDKLENGLIVGHAYSITSVKLLTLEANRKLGLVRVRNPWGNQYEWNGAWSDQSSEWDELPEEQKKSLELVIANDGEFWMSFRDFSTYFHQVEICNLGPDELASTHDDRVTWVSSIQEGGWKKKTNAGGCRNFPETFWINPQYHVRITDADDDDEDSMGTVVVGLLQKDGRKRKIEGREQLTIGYDIYEVDDQEQEKTMTKDFFVSKAPVAMVPMYSDMREVCGRHRLPPGNYVVVPTTFDPNEEGDFLLRVFTEKEAKVMEVDELTSVIRPEALGIHLSAGADLDPDVESLSEAEQKFSEYSGEDGSIDAFELLKILNDVFTKDFDFGEFDLNLCRSLVAMNDVKHSGLLDLAEFKRLWTDLQSWKAIYLKFDQDNSRYFNSNELREALASVGFKLSNGTFTTIVARCSNKDGQVHYDDFVFAIARLRTMFDTFHAQCQAVEPSSKASFTLDEFIQLTFYS